MRSAGDPAAAQDSSDRARPEAMLQVAQFALDPDHAPGPVLGGEADDQLYEPVVERRTSR
ncbi:hypothetical protein [Streptomyces brasiliensis]|uniref:Uncharacterized protein n=1 Tax=Streptomyces brasiliensis TaxID=1954 RepID=A0A917LEF3_9ACTN|nr:hypothetical protein [Streptomyces brasiliensis]GGJ59147.1 hypothetical protein GCM10010121_082280 [Streptomyces brasiliensis]